ncbi:hypothetical protein CMV_000071 [Castanea mollissima]|uniref:Myb/SANT-like domain-containing protein n=1 Tax=Castanea mollissima TaxID=60419 RepID=A0A8J4VXZ7_9ROSI|nr:hypothetical protein CMV_000071 [Castanea mollissima]
MLWVFGEDVKLFFPKQVIQKHNRLRQKQRKWSQLLSPTGLGWFETNQTVTASEEVWAYVVVGDPKAPALRKSGCPSYDKLRQLFAPNTKTSAFQIFSNTPTPDSDEKHALEEEISNEACHTQLGSDDCSNLDMEGITQDDPLATEQTQHLDKSPIEELTGKGKKVAKKADKDSDMTIALQEYTALVRERFNKKKRQVYG